MRIFDLVSKDIRQLLRDWKTLFFMLIMPIGFTLLFGFVFSGSTETQEDSRLPVGYFNMDSGALSGLLTDMLGESEVFRLDYERETQESLEEAVLAGDLAGAVIVPAGFSEATLAGEIVPLTVIINIGSTSGPTVQGAVQSVTDQWNNTLSSARISTGLYETHVGFRGENERRAYFESTIDQTLAAWENPPLELKKAHTGIEDSAETDEPLVYGSNPFSHSSAGMIAQFAIAGLMGAASILVLERKNGTMQRLMTTSLGRWEYLFGHYMTMFLMVFTQLVLLSVFGHLVLKVPYYNEPLATIPLIIVSALFSASLGLLIGAVARKEEHVIIMSLVLMFVLAGLGGAWVPLEFASETVQTIAHLTPMAWMVDGFKDVIVRGMGARAILPSLYVLFAFAAGLFILAVWRFRSV